MREALDPSALRVCYFNISPSDFSRSGVHIEALKKVGVQILSCVDSSPGVRKFWEIFKMHRALRGEYDAIIVGYPAYILVPFVRLLSRKPILFDAGWSLYEGTVVARGLYTHNPLRKLYYWCIDWLACRCADTVLLESTHQIEYYQKLLHAPLSKLKRLFTGVSETQFFIDPTSTKREEFTVLFRGYANPEAGLAHVLAVARTLEHEGVRFLIISPNARLKDVPSNVEIHEGFFTTTELRTWMQSCHMSIGQVSTHERLRRTIPHKAFESMLLHVPFLTADTGSIRELLDTNSAVLIQPGNEVDMVTMIRKLRDDTEWRSRLAEQAFTLYKEKCSNGVLAEELLGHIRSVLH